MSVDLRDCCVAQWKMNDNAANTDVIDSVGGYDGTAQQNTADLHVTGRIGGALTFNGSSDYIDIDAYVENFASMTEGAISLWFKVSSMDHTKMYFLFSISDASDFTYFAILLQGTIPLKGMIDVIAIQSSNGLFNWTGSDANWADNQWHNVVVLVSSSGNIVYMDGEINGEYLVGDENTHIFFGDLTNLDALRIGNAAYQNTETYFTLGTVDNVMIFNRVLTTDEIAFLYNNGNGTERLYTRRGMLI